ncbi:TIGR03016 family PEP-CTERM system-associated outer membrane protein [Kordiimonas aquimaris]|uniref:TIGR03016 family PEP-CTERM system-associated outer membrane protein n=1 Tax=Kordiimonas aquimaris TaxID=707591 RepID=UPI0021D081D5|nr:TIGR03016 family PEP-CTERM system-associated outer membrane protein [Kordiimonas aquimaris]
MQAVQAQHIYIDPRAETRFTVTDNANLTTSDRLTDGVFNNAIGVNARIDGARLRTSIDYSLDHFYFLSDGTDDYRQNLFGTLDAEVWKDHLVLNGRASLRQQFLDQRGSLSGSAANRTTNRRLVQTYTGTASFRAGLRDFADARITYRYGIQKSPADDLTDTTLPINFSDSTSHEINASIDSGDRFNNFQWRLFANSSRVFRNLDVNDFRNERAGGEVTLKFNRYFQLIGNINYSRNDFQSDVLSEDGFGWEAGFRWTPGRKLDLTFTAGKEGNREVYYASLQHFFTIRLSFTGSYTDTITANTIVGNDGLNSLRFDEEFGIVNNETLPIDETDPNFSFSDLDFRRRAFVGTFNLQQKRTRHFLTGNYELRTFDNNTGTGRAWGVTYGVNRKINDKAELSARLSYRQSLFEDGVRVDNFIVGNVTWSKRLSKRFRLALSFDHSQRQSNSDGGDLMENAATLYLRGTF